MKIKRVLWYIRQGDFLPFYRWFLGKSIWPLLHKDLTRRNAIKVMEEDWDYLIVLDACRYDIFKEMVDERANYVISGGTGTQQWLEWNFKVKYRDVIYIAGNPHLASAHLKRTLGYNPFYKVKEVWDYGWDENLKTVPPEEVTKAALDALKSFPDKRMVIHYNQPHHTFLGDRELTKMVDGTLHSLEGGLVDMGKITAWRLAREGKVSIDRVIKAYKENLRIVMKEVNKLKKELHGRVVLTSDHGNAIGEYGKYGHGGGLRIEGLVKVPWVIIKDEKEQKTYKEPDIERRRLQTEIMKLKESGKL